MKDLLSSQDRIRKVARGLTFGLLCLVPLRSFGAPPVIDPFYLAQLSEGQLLYAAGDYSEAVEYLQRAAFGLMESAPYFQKAQILLALSEQGRGNFVEARTAVNQVLRTETISPAYPPENLDPTVLARFEAAVRRLLPGREFPVSPPPASVPPEAVQEAQEPNPMRSEPSAQLSPDVEASIDRSDLRSLDDTVERIAVLTRQLRTSPSDIVTRLELARSYLSIGELDEARDLAESVLDIDADNVEARVVRARVAARRDRCEMANADFAAADRAGPLSSDDLGTWFVCQIAVGETEAAKTTATRLDPEVLARRDVRSALERIEPIDEDRND